MRRTKIICTIGPATESELMLKKLVKAGMNIARLNFSHGTHEGHKKIIQRIKKINKTLDNPIGIMLDTKGPEIRTMGIQDTLKLKKGENISFAYKSTCDEKETQKCIHVSYRNMVDDVNKGDIIVLDNGTIEILVTKKDTTHVYGKVLNKGTISNKKHINLPGVHVHLPAITSKDRKDIEFGIKNQVDFFALSFVRDAKNIEDLRKLLKKHSYTGAIIAKIEDCMAIKNLDAIIEASDGVMVARGDLGIELPIEEIPSTQKKIIERCLCEGKPVIVATHLLESMIENPIPTRAEATDIATAVWERSDATMLSGETTSGKFPIKSVEMMSKIVQRTERDMDPALFHPTDKKDTIQELARSASILAHNIQAKAIIVFTRSGKTAQFVSNFRPLRNIYAFTQHSKTQRTTSLYYGVKAYITSFYTDPEKTVQSAIQILRARKKIVKGDEVVLVSSILAGKEKHEAIQVRKIK